MLVANGFSVLLFLNHGNNVVPETIIMQWSYGLYSLGAAWIV